PPMGRSMARSRSAYRGSSRPSGTPTRRGEYRKTQSLATSRLVCLECPLDGMPAEHAVPAHWENTYSPSGGITMLSKHLAAGVLTLAGLALVGSARAADTVRLDLTESTRAPTLNLLATDADLDADTLTIQRRGGGRGFAGGGGRGFAVGGS